MITGEERGIAVRSSNDTNDKNNDRTRDSNSNDNSDNDDLPTERGRLGGSAAGARSTC